MKKEIKIYLLIAAMIFAGTTALNAQQKASDSPYNEELRKANEKKVARNAIISRMRQSTPAENNHSTPATGQPIHTETNAAENPRPATANPAPVNLKPSQQVMTVPKRKS
jgi:hypothetical protein